MRPRTTTTPLEAMAIVALCFGWFILVSLSAVTADFQSGSFSEDGIVGIVLLEAILGVSALLVLRSRGFDTASLYPHPTLKDAAMGVALAFAAAFFAATVSSVFNWSRYSEPIERVMGGSPIALPSLVLLGIVNGAYEEVFLLGFLLRGLREYGLSLAIGVSLLVRVLYHLYQGPVGAVYVGAFGLVLSVFYVAKRRLFPVVLAHAMWDIIPFLARGA